MLFGNKNQPPQPVNQQAQPSSGGAVIFEANAQDFEGKVLQASMEKPVIAYFTASWCGPCQQFGPQLEQAVMKQNGAILLAKIDMDANPDLAQALRIQSVPTIYGFFQGRPVDAFQGALPESQLQDFMDKLLEAARQSQPDALDIPEALKGAAQALSDGDYGAAQMIYTQILQDDQKNAQAYAGLVRTFIAAGHADQARSLVDGAPEELANNSVFAEARTALELAEAKPQGSVSELQANVEKDPEDLQARYDLAQALFSAGQKEEAVGQLLEILQRNREWNEEGARKLLLKFFEALGPSDPLTIQSRRRLSSILFS